MTSLALTKPKKTKALKSILAHHRTLTISSTLVVEEYTYVYLDGVTSTARDRETFTTERKRGWNQVAIERECKKSKDGHQLWFFRYVWQKPKRSRKIAD